MNKSQLLNNTVNGKYMKMKLETTLNLLEQEGMEQDKIDLLVEKLGKDYGKDKPFNFLIFLEVFPDIDGIDIFVDYFNIDTITEQNETINNFVEDLQDEIFEIFFSKMMSASFRSIVSDNKKIYEKYEDKIVFECHSLINENLSWD